MRLISVSVLTTVSLFLLSQAAFAQVAQPDSGRTLQEIQRSELGQPRAATSFDLSQPEASATTSSGGPQIAVERLKISGNTIFSEEDLIFASGYKAGVVLDLAGMKMLAERISGFYRAADYPFARALVPAQSMRDGVLQIIVVEGRYGDLVISGDESRKLAAQAFFSSLFKGQVIKGRDLERAALILDDQPGYSLVPALRPGTEIGTGDLLVDLNHEKKFSGDVGMDNQGNRYTGRYRAYGEFSALSPFMLGDEVRLGVLYTQEDLWAGSASYSLPIGYSGLRGNIGYNHTYYELGKDFASLDATGSAKVVSAGLTYPIMRSQKTNIAVGITYQHKWLEDKVGATNSSDTKFSDSVPVSLTFDHRDSFAGGAVTYGGITWVGGWLGLNDNLKTIDDTTARSDGRFDKLSIDVARLQSLYGDLTLFGRFAGQLAFDNLDSSESFGLGGPEGVRAYPSGEGYGDEGMLAQFELRYRLNSIEPYVFYDIGHIQFNNDRWDTSDNDQTIAGAGLGVRFEYEGWHADGSVAWSTRGGAPQSDSKDENPVVWIRAGYRF